MFKWFFNLFRKRKSPREENELGFKFFYPKAVFLPHLPKLKTPWKTDEMPEIAVVHHTAGWQNQSGESFMKNFLKRGLCCLFIDEKGKIYQQPDIKDRGYHAGVSEWKGKKGISKHSVGIEIAAGGKLERRKDGVYTWFEKKVPTEKSRHVKTANGYNDEGFFEAFTNAQEIALAELLTWLKKNGVKEIVEHSDISPGRKNDPGGSLSQPLSKWIRGRVKA